MFMSLFRLLRLAGLEGVVSNNTDTWPVKLPPTVLVLLQVFVATPTIITFTDYQVGQVYETTLDLKNMSSSLRPVRVLPTSTNFFSVGLGKLRDTPWPYSLGLGVRLRGRTRSLDSQRCSAIDYGFNITSCTQ